MTFLFCCVLEMSALTKSWGATVWPLVRNVNLEGAGAGGEQGASEGEFCMFTCELVL